MKKLDHKNLKRRKKKITKRLERRNWEAQSHPMFSGSNIQYEVDGRQQGIAQGGIGAMAPTRRGDLARLGSRALLAGFIATLINASIAAVLL